MASAPSTSRSALDAGPSTSAAAAGEVAAYETVTSAGPSTSAAARAATKKAAPKKATPKRGARARGRGGRGRAPENEGTGDDSVTAIDEFDRMMDDSAPAAVEYTPERSEPDEIDAREFSNNVSAMFDLSCGGDGGGGSGDDDDDSDEESVYHSCEDSDEGEGGGGGSADGSTLNADQIVERMRTMFETSLMLHAKGKYMKVIDSKFDIFLILD